MEIKQGDKVRVSKDAPKMYLYPDSPGDRDCECIVKDTDGDNAYIEPKELGYFPFTSVIPTKYLIKVDAEAKEAKFKKGDRVKVNLPRSIRHNTIGTVVFAYASGNAVNVDFGDDNEPIYCDCDCLELYTEPTAPKFKVGDRVRSKGYGFEAVVLGVYGDYIAVRRDDGIKQEWKRYMTELVEPKEQTEADKKPNVGSIKIPVEVDFKEVAKEYAEAMSNAIREYGDALCKHGTFIRMVDDLYKRDLAKEVALKVANKYSDPEQAAEYAVSVAKAVVEGLKRK